MEGEGRPEPKVVTVCRSKGLDEVALQGQSREGRGGVTAARGWGT